MFTTSDWISLGSASATFVGVVLAAIALWFQLRQINQQLTLQYFSDYTKRYQEIIQKFPEEINELSFKLEGREDYKQSMRAMRTYFDLCFEEWYLKKLRFIDDKIWVVWQGGMKTAFSKPAFQQAWEIVSRDTRYGSEFERFVDELIGGATTK